MVGPSAMREACGQITCRILLKYPSPTTRAARVGPKARPQYNRARFRPETLLHEGLMQRQPLSKGQWGSPRPPCQNMQETVALTAECLEKRG